MSSVVDVPKDGNCVVHAIALSYLWSHRKDRNFADHVDKVFGQTSLPTSTIQDAIQSGSFKTMLATKHWTEFVQNFRENLVDFMKSMQEDFTNRHKYPDAFMPKNDSFLKATTFDEYLSEIRKNGVWLGSLEIRAFSQLLRCPIVVRDDNQILANYGDIYALNGTLAICLVLSNNNHYDCEIAAPEGQSVKRKAPDASADDFCSQSSSLYDNFVDNAKKMKLTDDDQEPMEVDDVVKEEYKASGVKRALHGTIFQLELLMLYAERGKTLFDFRLATEMDAAEKFDDVVFQYKNDPDSQWKIKFLQAKHKQDTDKNKITARELTSWTDDSFSLQKYFVSFCKIKNQTLFQDSVLEEFTILTNTDFDLEANDKDTSKVANEKAKFLELVTEPRELDEDDILFFDAEDHVEVRFKHDANANLAEVIKSALEDGIREAEKKAGDVLKLLYESRIVPSQTKADLKDCIQQGFYVITNTLLFSVLEVEKTFNKLELKSKNTPGELKSLAEKILLVGPDDELEQELHNMSQRKRSLANQKANFLSKAREGLIRVATGLPTPHWLKPLHQDDSEDNTKIGDLKMALDSLSLRIEEFISKFRFVTRYPDVDCLNDLIGREVGVDFNLLNASLITDSLEKTMLNWLKQKLGTFISKDRCETIFRELKTTLNGVLIAGLGKAYPEKLGRWGFTFSNQSVARLVEFLTDDSAKQIFHLTVKQPKLGAAKVLQALNNSRLLQVDDNCIFVRLKTLLLPNIQKMALDAFSSSKNHRVLVIVCRSAEYNANEVKFLIRNVTATLKKLQNKKVILVSSEGDLFANKFSDSAKIKVTDETTFQDLDPRTQNQILGSLVNFQGKYLELDGIMDANSANEVMTEDILLALAKKECLALGDQRFRNLDFVEDFYVSRRLHHQRIRPSALNSLIDRVFITNVIAEELIKVGVRQSKLSIMSDSVVNDIIIAPPSVSMDDGRDFFSTVCDRVAGNVHWLDYDKGNFYWIASRQNWTVLQPYVEDNTSECEDRYSLHENVNANQKVVVVADSPGKGKSTFVSKLATKMKDRYPDRWVVRLNFNDYGSDSHPQSLKKINFDPNDVHSAIEYLVSIVVSDGDNVISTALSKNILRVALNPNNDKIGPKVYVFFDGFDEIVPTFKDEAINLLKSLRNTKLAQMWITTRPHVKAALEEHLQCPAYVLNFWSNFDKIDFLNRFWTFYLSNNENGFKENLENLLDVVNGATMPDNIKKSIDNLIENIVQIFNNSEIDSTRLDFSGFAALILTKWTNSVPKNEKTMMDIPLHLKMYAEIIFKGMNKLKEDFNLFNLYSDFVDYKFNIFYTDKKVICDSAGGKEERLSSTVNLTKIHQGLAAKLFFPNVESLPGLENLENEVEALKSVLDFRFRVARVGLLQTRQTDEELKFVHRSFGEYFLCQWLTRHLKHEPTQTILLRIVLLEADFVLACYFFDDYVALNWQSISTVQLKEKLIREVIRHDVETLEKDTVLHVAVKREHENVINFLIDKFRSKGEQYLEGLLDATNRGQFTALQTAALENRVTCFNLLLSHHMSDIHKTLHDLAQIAKFYGHRDTMSIEIVLSSVRFLKSKYPLALRKFLLAPTHQSAFDRQKTTILYRMVKFKRCRSIAALLKEVSNRNDLEALVMATDDHGQTAFAVALEQNGPEVVETLIESLKEHQGLLKRMLLKRDNRGNVLHLAVRNNNLNNVVALLTSLERVLTPRDFEKFLSKLVLARNYYDKTIFYVSLEIKSFDCLKVLLERFMDDSKFYVDFAAISVHAVKSLHGAYQQLMDDFLAVCQKFLKVDSSVFEAMELNDEALQRNVDQLPSCSVLNALENESQVKVVLIGGGNILNVLSEQTDATLSAVILEKLNQFPNIFRCLALDSDDKGNTILHRLAEQPNITFLTVFLVDFNVDLLEEVLTSTNVRKETCIHVAAIHNQLEFIKTVFENVQNHELISGLLLALDDDNFTPLELCIFNKCTETFTYLLEEMARQVAPDQLVSLTLANTKHTETLLYNAVRRSTSEISRALIFFINQYLDKYFPGLLKVALSHSNEFEYSLSKYSKGNVLFAAVKASDATVIPLVVNTCANVFESEALRRFACSTRSNGFNFVHQASSDGPAKNLEVLLKGLNLDNESLRQLLMSIDNRDSQYLPLHRAAYSDNSESADFLLRFAEEYFKADVSQMMFATNVSRDTPLMTAAYQDSVATFKVLMNFTVNVLEKREPGTLRRLLTMVNVKGQSVLFYIIVNIRDELFDVLMKSLSGFGDVLDELLLMRDNDGRTILFPIFCDDEITSMIKKLLKKVNNRTVLERLLLQEEYLYAVPLEYAYWNAEGEENCYVEFLTKLMSNNQMEPETILRRAKVIADKREELIEAVTNSDIEQVKNILIECRDYRRKLLLYEEPRLMNSAILHSNNVDILETILDDIKDDHVLLGQLLLQNSALKYASVHCSYEMVKVLMRYAKMMQQSDFMNKFLLADITIRFLCFKNRKEHQETIELLKEETNRLAIKLLSQKRTDEDEPKALGTFTSSQLTVLRTYVESNEYNGQHREEILTVILTELRRRNDESL